MRFQTLCGLMNIVEEEIVDAPKGIFDDYWAFRTGMAEFYGSAKPETKVPDDIVQKFRPFIERYAPKRDVR